MFPERVLAWIRHDPQPPASVRSATLDDMVAGDSPWLVLADVPGVVVLGLLWKPPAGGARCVPGSFASFAKPGFATVAHHLAVRRAVAPAGPARHQG